MSTEIRAARLEERPAVCHLISMAFDAEWYGPSLEQPCKSVGKSHMDPHDRPENTRILLIDECGKRIPFGFIAMVATHPGHRNKGYMKRTMADAEEYMRGRGFCYAALLGGLRVYGGSLAWHNPREKCPTLPWKYELPCQVESGPKLSTRLAEETDIPLLSRVYETRYAARFGPVVRSPEYWQRWSLQCSWEGTYVIVCRGAKPQGYFHIDPSNRNVDEIGWEEDCYGAGGEIFLAAASWAAEKGSTKLGFFCIDEVEDVASAAFSRAFGEVPRTYCKPNGQPAEGSDPTPYLPEKWPEGMGIMVKFLNRGPGILADVDSMDALTEAMARNSWTWFDGDTM